MEFWPVWLLSYKTELPLPLTDHPLPALRQLLGT